jgi:hypothetical protein
MSYPRPDVMWVLRDTSENSASRACNCASDFAEVASVLAPQLRVGGGVARLRLLGCQPQRQLWLAVEDCGL